MKKRFWISLLVCLLSVQTFSQSSQGAFDLLRQGEYKKLIRYCDKNVQSLGEEEAMYLKGVAYYAQEGRRWPFQQGRKTKKALSLFTLLASKHPDEFRYQFRLGLCYYRIYDLEKAKELFAKSMILCRGNEWPFWFHLYSTRYEISKDSIATEKTLMRLHDIMYSHEDSSLQKLAQSWGFSLSREHKSIQYFNFDLTPNTFYRAYYIMPFQFPFDTLKTDPNCQTEREKYGWFYWHKPDTSDTFNLSFDSLPYNQFLDEMTLEKLLNIPENHEIISLSLTELLAYSIRESPLFPEKWHPGQFANMMHGQQVYLENTKIRNPSNPNEIIAHRNQILYFKLRNPEVQFSR